MDKSTEEPYTGQYDYLLQSDKNVTSKQEKYDKMDEPHIDISGMIPAQLKHPTETDLKLVAEQRVMQFGQMTTNLHEDCEKNVWVDENSDEEWNTLFSTKYPLIKNNDTGNFDFYEDFYDALKEINHPQASAYSWISTGLFLLKIRSYEEEATWISVFQKSISTDPYAIVPVPPSTQVRFDKHEDLINRLNM